jgi:hypothetical protein
VSFDPACLVNIGLAVMALCFYVVGSRRFYRQQAPFILWFVVAIAVDALTAVLASFGITPTTMLPGMRIVPWGSPLFILHITFASIGFFGFIAMVIAILTLGKERPYPRLRVLQYKALLPVWLIGESIALVNSVMKLFFQVRLFDYA